MNIHTNSMPPPEGATRTHTTIDAYDALVEVSSLLRVIFLVADSSALVDDRDRDGLQSLLMHLDDRLEAVKAILRAEIDEWRAAQ